MMKYSVPSSVISRLFLRRVWNDDAANHLLRVLDAFDDKPVVEWANLDSHELMFPSND